MTVDAKERALRARWDRICARMGDRTLDSLDRDDRIFAAIWMLEAEVNNGGFGQWMFNSYGAYAELTVAALRDIGADRAANVCVRFLSMLPGRRPGVELVARQQQLDVAAATLGSAFDEACRELEQEFYALEDDLRDRLYAFSESSEPRA